MINQSLLLRLPTEQFSIPDWLPSFLPITSSSVVINHMTTQPTIGNAFFVFSFSHCLFFVQPFDQSSLTTLPFFDSQLTSANIVS